MGVWWARPGSIVEVRWEWFGLWSLEFGVLASKSDKQVLNVVKPWLGLFNMTWSSNNEKRPLGKYFCHIHLFSIQRLAKVSLLYVLSKWARVNFNSE